MIQLLVDPQDPVWARVAEALQARKLELLDEVTSLIVDDRQRRDAAVRIDEINAILGAPRDAAAAVQARYDAEGARRSIY